MWASLQLSWTVLLVVSQAWQISRQMTTLEVTNLGRYGFMGGRGGSSLRDQSGAVGVGGRTPSRGEDDDGAVDPDPTGVADPDPLAASLRAHVHAHAQHQHHHQGNARCFGGCSRFLMQILGLDRFTKGKAAKGLRMASREANPFDTGLFGVCSPLRFCFCWRAYADVSRRMGTELYGFLDGRGNLRGRLQTAI